MKRKTTPAIDRFNARIKRDKSGCWLWTACKHPFGYGRIRVNSVNMGAHRAAWLLYRGKIPEGMSVCHKCDKPACCNPDHLFLGTQADNMADMGEKCRQARGERQGLAKLTEADVRAIRADPDTQENIAKKYGTCFSTIGKIKRRAHWKHVA